MHVNDFKKQSGMRQTGTAQRAQDQGCTRDRRSIFDGFKSQSGMKIVDLTIYYCTKCGLPSPVKLPTKCPAGGYHVWAKSM